MYDLSDDDIEFIKESYSTLSYKDIQEKFKLRNVGQVKYLLQKLNLTGDNEWSTEELDFLTQNYQALSDYDMAEYLGKTVSSVIHKRSRMKLNRKESHIVKYPAEKNWKQQELDFLKQTFGYLSYEEIAEALHRPKKGVMVKASRLGLASDIWSQEDINFVKENYATVSTDYLSSVLHRSPKAIKHVANKLHVFKDGNSTEPERIMQDILTELNVIYAPQLPIGKYIVDFWLGDKVIEVNGDYWHCNPDIYSEPINEIQKYNVKKDQEKYAYLNSIGLEVLIFWENEILSSKDNIIERFRRHEIVDCKSGELRERP